MYVRVHAQTMSHQIDDTANELIRNWFFSSSWNDYNILKVETQEFLLEIDFQNRSLNTFTGDDAP